MSTSVSEFLAALDVPGPKGYEDLGGDWDEAVGKHVRLLGLHSPQASEELHLGLTTDRSWSLLGYAQGCAVLAVRESDVEPLIDALIALSLLAAGPIDTREIERVRTLVFRSAEILAESPEPLVRRAVEASDDGGGAWLLSEREYRTTPSDMAFREVGSGQRFRYENTIDSIDIEQLTEFMGEDH